jgi:hypothetical protein
MTALFATLLLATSMHSANFRIGADVVRSSSISVDSRGNGAVQVSGSSYGTAAAALIEASSRVKVRVAGNVLETRGSGVVRVTLYADGAPPAKDDASVASNPRRHAPVELRDDVRVLALRELPPMVEVQ